MAQLQQRVWMIFVRPCFVRRSATPGYPASVTKYFGKIYRDSLGGENSYEILTYVPLSGEYALSTTSMINKTVVSVYQIVSSTISAGTITGKVTGGTLDGYTITGSTITSGTVTGGIIDKNTGTATGAIIKDGSITNVTVAGGYKTDEDGVQTPLTSTTGLTITEAKIVGASVASLSVGATLNGFADGANPIAQGYKIAIELPELNIPKPTSPIDPVGGGIERYYDDIKGRMPNNVPKNSTPPFNENGWFSNDPWMLHSTWTSFEECKNYVRVLIDLLGFDGVLVSNFVGLDLELLPNK